MLYRYIDYLDSPIGTICIRASDRGITDLFFTDEKNPNYVTKNLILKKCKTQLQEYFEGTRKEFEIELDMYGTQFQKNVWDELIAIPFGGLISYAKLSIRIGNEKKIRAVAKANAQNKIGIVVPCHRVIGSNSELVGYAGGLWRKKWLIEHEEYVLLNQRQLSFFDS
jgi:methylated-DNA-[protein]-cysteine S-methyltransferase